MAKRKYVRKKLSEKTCANCGKAYSGNPRSLFCSEKCGRANARRRYNAGKALGRYVPAVTMLDVAVASDERCHICGLPCKLGYKPKTSLEYLTPAATTMDHLIPTSRGGPHIIANVRLAHMICNTEKDTLLSLSAKAIRALRLRVAQELGIDHKDYPMPIKRKPPKSADTLRGQQTIFADDEALG